MKYHKQRKKTACRAPTCPYHNVRRFGPHLPSRARPPQHLVFGLVLWSLLWTTPVTACLSDGRYVMGTILEITLCGTDITQGHRTLDPLFATATRFDTLFTTFSPDSPLSQLNAKAGQGDAPVPPEVSDILSLSLRYWRLTQGAFDITVGPLLALWRQAGDTHTSPSPAALHRILTRVGSQNIRLSPHGNVSLTHAGMALDLGGIGKGYALDRLATLLRARRAAHALLDFGQSSQWALGAPPDAAGWRLLVRQPNGKIVGVVTLRDQALSVSGSLGYSFEVEGQRYGHVIDPRTGTPVHRDLLACVTAPSAAQAEALSTALLVLGEEAGIALLEDLPDVEGMLIEASGQRWVTTGWEQAVAFVAL